jgi:hypothetical protein
MTNYATDPLIIYVERGMWRSEKGILLPECSLVFKIRQALITRVVSLMSEVFERILYPEDKAKQFVENITDTTPGTSYTLYHMSVTKRSDITHEKLYGSFLEVIFGPVTSDRPKLVLTSDGVYVAIYTYHLHHGDRVIYALIPIVGNINPVTFNAVETALNKSVLCIYSQEISYECTEIDI